MVEFALFFIMFMAVMFAIISFSMAVYAYNSISNAAREGTRYGMVHGANCWSNGTSCALSSSQIASYVASKTINTSALTVNVYCGPGGSTPPTGDCGQSTSGTPNDNPGNVVYVKVIYQFTAAPSLVPVGPITMTTASQRVIWQ